MKVVSTKGKKRPPLLVASVGIRLEAGVSLTQVLALGAATEPMVITTSDISTNAVFFFIAPLLFAADAYFV